MSFAGFQFKGHLPLKYFSVFLAWYSAFELGNSKTSTTTKIVVIVTTEIATVMLNL